MQAGHETAANRNLTYLKVFFSWAMDRDIITSDPTDRIKPPGEERSRERVLELDEMRAIWRAADVDDLFGDIVKVLMLTGQRRGEVGGMRWAEVDFENSLWSILGEIVEKGKRIRRTKNGRDHIIPLSAPVVKILHKRQQVQAAMGIKTRLAFTTRGKAPFAGWSKSKIRLDGTAETFLRDITRDPDAELTRWTLHDLRRTFVTRMSEDLKILPHVVEVTINHASGFRGGIAGTYNRARYVDERRKALEAWSDYVLRLVGEAEEDNIARFSDRHL